VRVQDRLSASIINN